MSWVPRIGEEFAGYRLDALLGHGGMSIVYRAEHITLGRKVALKLLSPQLDEDDSFRERFTRESRLAASLDHPNIIPIYEAAESDGTFYIAMRYVDGSDLRAIVKQGPIAPDRLAPIIDQTANALAAAHAHGLVHRDVKPANVLIDPGDARGEPDHVYLSDFGVAKQTAAPGVTKTGMFVGTAEYSAPEQIEGKELDARADVYSLGCMVYECLTGAAVFADKDTGVALMYAHLLEPPPRVSDRRPDLPPTLDDVVGKAMAKSRDDRYDGPKEFAAALRGALADAPAKQAAPPTVAAPGLAAAAAAEEAAAPAAAAPADATPAATPGGGPPPTAPPAAAPAAAAGGGSRSGRNRSVVIASAIAVALALALAVALGFLLTGGDSNSSANGGTGTTTPTGSGGAADTLLAVLAPTQIAHDCTTKSVPRSGAVETNSCVPPANAPTDTPNDLELDFYPSAQALEQGYKDAQAGMKPARCGATVGERVWFHPTGKRGGRRVCFTDSQGRFVVVWTHEKLGSPDHVDMVGIAREPGRAPTTFQSWWGSVNDFIGKCRPKVAESTCSATINALSK
jgi:tRNA A-37 threonylcarbamoyl transferase component Bud32